MSWLTGFLFGSANVDLHAIHQCTACGDFECHDAECVRREYKERAQRILRRLRERNDGERVMISLGEIDDLLESIDMHWRPYAEGTRAGKTPSR